MLLLLLQDVLFASSPLVDDVDDIGESDAEVDKMGTLDTVGVEEPGSAMGFCIELAASLVTTVGVETFRGVGEVELFALGIGGGVGGGLMGGPMV